MKFLLLTYTLILFSFNTWANPICENKATIKRFFYSNFMHTSHTLQYGYTPYYQSVSKKFDEALISVCTKNPSIQETTNEIRTVCLKTCDENASRYFTGALESTKKNQKLLFNECATLCNVTSSTIHLMGLSQDESGCIITNALNINDSKMMKEIDRTFKIDSNLEKNGVQK